jgi:hypothetical protein
VKGNFAGMKWATENTEDTEVKQLFILCDLCDLCGKIEAGNTR